MGPAAKRSGPRPRPRSGGRVIMDRRTALLTFLLEQHRLPSNVRGWIRTASPTEDDLDVYTEVYLETTHADYHPLSQETN
jgi:hypothetical protein